MLTHDTDDTPVERWPDDIPRANGKVICLICGLALDRHYQPAGKTCPTLVIDCEGKWLKT